MAGEPGSLAPTLRRWSPDAPTRPEELCPGHQEGVVSLGLTTTGLLVVATQLGSVEVWVLP